MTAARVTDEESFWLFPSHISTPHVSNKYFVSAYTAMKIHQDQRTEGRKKFLPLYFNIFHIPIMV
jgi:hypothetical protein